MMRKLLVLLIIFLLFLTKSILAQTLTEEIVVGGAAEKVKDLSDGDDMVINGTLIPIKRIFFEETGVPVGNEMILGQEFQVEVEEMSAQGMEMEESTLDDGMYEIRNALLDVLVSILDGKIIDIKILKHRGGGDAYKEKIEPLIRKIIESQSTEVDAISGATMYSDALKNAVEEAIKKATSEKHKK